MDDIYFSDNKKKNDQMNKNRNTSRDKFVGADYYDESFDLKFRSRGNAQAFGSKKNKNFQVNIPESELGAPSEVQMQDRTPRGRAVSRMDTGSGYPYGNSVNNPVNRNRGPVRNNDSCYTAQQGRIQSQQQGNFYQSQGNVHNECQQSRVPKGNRAGVSAAHQQNLQRAAAADINNREAAKSGRKSRTEKERSSSGKKIFVGFMCLILILVAALGVFGLSAINSLTYDDTIVPNQYISESELYSSPSVKNILLIGSDARGDVDGQRSDTMILFSIDKKNGQIKLTSFLRDSYVYIPSKGYKNKLNSAFSYGGTQLVIDTIEYNFGINIDNYVMVSFDAFQQLIDLMGGVTIEGVTAKEAQYMNDVVDIKSVKEGTNKMNGFTALWYCRIRKLDSDFYRTQRQRKVISAVLNQAKKTNPFTLASICKQVLPNISTDINKSELTTLAVGAVISFLRYDIVQQQVPADGTWSAQRINGSDVIAMNIDENKSILQNFLEEKYVEPEAEEE